jgi:hypothetical protein
MIRDVLALVVIYAIAWFVLAIPECATEDSANCVWYGATHGNGQGSTFIDINGKAYTLWN